MVALMAATAAIYAVLLVPFKDMPLVPGITEFRPAQVVAATLPIFFGPAGAWGLAMGNLFADLFGTFSAASIFGFFGNLFMGIVYYKFWRAFKLNPVVKSWRTYGFYALTVITAAALCGAIIAWGVESLGMWPFASVAIIIPLNNAVLPLIFGPLILFLLHPALKRNGLLWEEVMGKETVRGETGAGIRIWGIRLTVLGSLGALFLGLLISTGVYQANLGALVPGVAAAGVIFTVGPLLLIALVALLFLI